LEGLEAKGFASNNLVFGIGSFTYNYLTRDTFGFAVKATWGQVNGVGRELFKDPITDSGVKKSAKVYYASKKVKLVLPCLMSKQRNKNKAEH
jgi:nicotinamide phosphoribosyltransferase